MGYQPVLADRIRSGVDSPSAAASPGLWPRDAMNVYTNDLFKDEDLGNVGIGGHPQMERPGGSQKMMAQKSALAARRAERLQANIYQSNSNSMTRAPGPPGAPRPPPLEQHHLPDNQGMMQHHQQQQQQQDGSNVFGLKGTYDPNDERPRQIAVNGGLGIVNPRPPLPPPQLDLSNLPAFLMQPGPKEGLPIMCYIMRDKGSAKMYPRYNLYLEDPKMFLLAARKRKKQTTSNYLVSLDPEDLNRDSSKYFGKLRANFVGTEFTIFDGGDKPDKKGGSSEAEGQRQELGCVTYQYNVLGTRGPRKMTGVIPALDGHGRKLYRPANESDNISERLKSNKGLNELVVMHNKPPRWNDELNAYCLNFNGRVTEASVKNFQLVTEENQNHVILQFGKISKNAFTMDYMWPISAFQAFSICLSSFDNKLACE